MPKITRRFFLCAASITAGSVVGSLLLKQNTVFAQTSPVSVKENTIPSEYILPPLPYPYDALEPYIDQTTVKIHHMRHHAGYTKGLNKTLKTLADARKGGDYSNIQHLSRLLAFHMSGYLNHNLYWENMGPAGKGGNKPKGALSEMINREFGNFRKFKDHLSAAAKSVEGNGWGLLAWQPMLHRPIILTVMNHQDLLVTGAIPLLIIDVWEHAYYLQFKNQRDAYIDAWWNVVNWKNVENRFRLARDAELNIASNRLYRNIDYAVSG